MTDTVALFTQDDLKKVNQIARLIEMNANIDISTKIDGEFAFFYWHLTVDSPPYRERSIHHNTLHNMDMYLLTLLLMN